MPSHPSSDRTDSSPSGWTHRILVLVLAALGCGIATYLTLFQVHVLPSVWDPFFGPGSRRVLTSGLSQSLPVPDASLGAGAYLAEGIATAIGGARRWRTMPWVVLGSGVIMAGLALAAIGLVAAQLFVIHAFCTLCLTSAAISLTIGSLGLHEVLAAFGCVRRRLESGVSLRTALVGASSDHQSVENAS